MASSPALLFTFCLSLLLHLTIAAQELQVLHTFRTNDGSWPQGVLVQSADGMLYGTTHYGGAGVSGGGPGPGTVFRITTNGQLATLLHLGPGDSPRYIRAGLVQARNAAFYGITYRSTLLRGSTNGEFSTWITLNGATEGYFLDSALIEGQDGALYGTALVTTAGNNHGTLFRVTTDGISSLLASFHGTNGSSPRARLLQAADGYLYGTTELGGGSNLGTVFRCDTNGNHSMIVSFNGTNGARPYAGLVHSVNGIFYGTTYAGGAHNAGTVFQMTTNGVLTTLLSFNTDNGAGPTAELVMSRNGLFYGTTTGGGANDLGTVFQMDADGRLATLATFGGTNGSHPHAGVTQGTDGHLYGSAQRGGIFEVGAIYRVLLPSLSVSRQDTNLIVSWPTNATDFVLQRSGPDPFQWADCTNLTIGSLGNAFVITNPVTSAAEIFRLRKP